MRIISGKARGTKLYTLEGQNTRPTLDRVKESLFNILQPQIPESIFLDLFSGSGAIGLEAVSRGAKKAILCDKEKSAIQIIKKNIEKTHLEEQIELYQLPFEKLLKEKIKEKLDIIYIDPPYQTDYAYQATKLIIENQLTKEEAIIIIETDEEERIQKQIKELKVNIIDQRKYGRAHLIFLKENREN
ncbi:MAG: 16S rRNA (guanine(966)-N(2))-methyltransferase RsmD [Clostridia bacterium]|nr:16S rRNA (guanine(966)-N(2))-methyltransferase RsmD [Clostridia bacterium]